jgi:signal transduction histidine kinase
VSAEDFRVLAKEQAALRRVATLVARGAPPEELFAAVTLEVERLFVAEVTSLARYDPDGAFTVVGSSARLWPAGSRWPLGGKNVITLVSETARPARFENYAEATGGHVDRARTIGLRSSVAAPIIVEAALWGAIVVATTQAGPLPADTEARLSSFTELVAMAIANTQARTELAASRARIVTAADETRRQIQRDLHDGAQQRLVHTVIVLKLAARALNSGDADATDLVAEAQSHAEEANSELRELAHGILPAALTRHGLRGGLQALTSRIPLPVTVRISVDHLPASVEAAGYFIVCEALTNVLKHAHADRATVTIQANDGLLQVEIRDDGIGGADPERGSGLIGLTDRVAALAGTLQLTSPTGSGTTLVVHLPIEEHRTSAVAAQTAEGGPPAAVPSQEQAKRAGVAPFSATP